MVEKIYEIKNKILQRVEKDTMNMERIDVEEVGKLVDMVKDLAEAEEKCWKAQYYRKVTEAMDQGQQAGYGGGTGSSAGYGSGGSGGGGGQGGGGGRQGYGTMARQGYSGGGGGSQGYGSMGHEEFMEPLRMTLQQANPDERERLRNEVMKTIGMM